ncbi:MAG: carbon starvation CstA family protein [Kiritimatiellia bacterium]
MTALAMLLGSAAMLLIAGWFYSRFLARRWGEDPARPTPAERLNDGRDYVPTPTPIVFAHHFASIAGAGPIVGPVLALCFGWGPALLWIVLGGLFIGGVHDYLAAFMSVRNDGQSLATIARRLLGRGPFLALMLFLVLMLGLVTAVFLNTSASALVSMLDFGRMQIDGAQTLFRVVNDGGIQKVVIGGVASMSVIAITLCAPLVGWMYIIRKVSVWKCSLLAIVLCILSIVIGLFHPVVLPDSVQWGPFCLTGAECWKLLLGLYTLVAAGVPVWLFLQSRDFINVHILYAGIAFLFIALITASLKGGMPPPENALPVFDNSLGVSKIGSLWPWLFITIACGAVSGFHSLCAGGTTCKQLKSESATRALGYWGMLLESFLAVAVICTLVVGTTRGFYLEDVFPVGKDNNPVLGFAFAVGRAGQTAFGLPIVAGALAGMLLLEGFVITTLDTAVRLNRYLIEEVWQEFFGRFDIFATRASRFTVATAETAGTDGIPASVDLNNKVAEKTIATSGPLRVLLTFLGYYWVNSGLAVALMLGLSFSGSILQLWKIFGTANQLLAAFALGIGAIWLLRNGRRAWYVMLPAAFMLATTIAGLVLLMAKFKPGTGADGKPFGNGVLFAADLVLITLTAYLAMAGIRELIRRAQSRPA